MGPRGGGPPKPGGEGGRGQGGEGGRGKGGGDGETKVVLPPTPNGTSVPKPNAKPLPKAAPQKPGPKVTAAQKKVAAERLKVEQAVREEQAKVAAHAKALEAKKQAALDEEKRLKELQAEEVRKINVARTERNRLRTTNLDSTQKIPSDTKKKMDSSIKKNTALTKKLGKVSEETKESTLTDLQSTNASKYLTEAATAIVGTKLKSNDVPAVVEIISWMHRCYDEDFSIELIEKLPRVIFPDSAAFQLKKGKGTQSEDVANDDASQNTPLQKRLKFRLLIESHLVGVSDSAKPVYACVAEFCKARWEKDPEVFSHSLASLAVFAKMYGEEFIRVASEDESSDEKVSTDSNTPTYSLSPERRAAFRDTHLKFHVHASLAVLDIRSQVKWKEKEIKTLLERTGEVSEVSAAALAELKKSKDALTKNLEILTEALGGEKDGVTMPPEKLHDDSDDAKKPTGSVELSTGFNAELKSDQTFWDDEEQRFFYETLPALKETVPKGLLPIVAEGDAEGSGETSSSATPSNPPTVETRARLSEFEETLLSRVRQCSSWTQSDADSFSSDFCYFATGPVARRLLADEILVAVRREGSVETSTSTSGTACVARVLATLASTSPVFEQEITSVAVKAVTEDFDTFFSNDKKRKNQKDITDAFATTKFLGELVKFRVVQSEWVFSELKSLLQKLGTTHSVDVLCALLQTCGRYLSRRLDTKKTTNSFLDVFLRLKAVEGGLSVEHSELVDATYLICRPPVVSSRRSKKKDPIRLYIKFVIDKAMREWKPVGGGEGTDNTSESTSQKKPASKKSSRYVDTKDDTVVRRCVRALRKVDWPRHEQFVIHQLVKGAVSLGRIESASAATRIVAGLDMFRESVVPKSVDAVLEEQRFLLEVNKVNLSQRKVACGRLLGELFVSRLVGINLVLAQLYQLMSFTGSDTTDDYATSETQNEINPSDPPTDLIRVRVSLAVLEVCLRRLDPKTVLPQVKRYFTYFQRYVLSKKITPELAIDVRETLSSYLGDDGENIFHTFTDANAACQKIEQEDASGDVSNGNSAENGQSTYVSDDEIDIEDEDVNYESESDEDIVEDERDAMDVGDAKDVGAEERGEEESGSDSDSDASDSDDSDSDADSNSESDSDASYTQPDSENSLLSDEDEFGDTIAPLVSEVKKERVLPPQPSREDEVNFEREMMTFLGAQGGGVNGGQAAGTRTHAERDAYRGSSLEGCSFDRGHSSQLRTTPVAKKAFKMLVRRDGKVSTATLDVPENAKFVVDKREKQLKEQRERAELKALVLASAEAAEERESILQPRQPDAIRPSAPVVHDFFSSATFARPGRGRGRGR